jgi:hypothetical protein
MTEDKQVVRNAIIKSANLDYKDHGTLTVWLTLSYGDGNGQGFGGYALYLPKSFKHHDVNGPAGHFIFRCLEIADVTSWDAIAGKSIRVVLDKPGFSGNILGIGHITKDDWFYPEVDLKGDKQ